MLAKHIRRITDSVRKCIVRLYESLRGTLFVISQFSRKLNFWTSRRRHTQKDREAGLREEAREGQIREVSQDKTALDPEAGPKGMYQEALRKTLGDFDFVEKVMREISLWASGE